MPKVKGKRGPYKRSQDPLHAHEVEKTVLGPMVKKEGPPVPFLEVWVKTVKADENTFTPTAELFQNWQQWIKLHQGELAVANSVTFSGFAKKLRCLSAKYQWQYRRRNKCGYLVTVPRWKRSQNSLYAILSDAQRVDNFLANSENVLRSWKRIYVGTKKGCGAITVVTIPANTVIAEYEGQEMSEAEENEREQEYQQMGLPGATIRLSGD